MSNVIFNGEYFDDSLINININNRAFSYGDSLFETIIYKNNEINLWDYHFERLEAGMKILGYDYSNHFDNQLLKSKILYLIQQSGSPKAVRIRLQVWRKPGGLYTPSNNDIEYCISHTIFDEHVTNRYFNTTKNCVGISDKINLNYSNISSLKTCNSIPYIVAANEKTQKKWSDIILLDGFGHVAECNSSNIFWWDGEKIFTPSLQSGCIAGVMRRHLLQVLNTLAIPIKEGLFDVASLMNAKAVFSTNCTGLKFIDQLIFTEDHFYEPDNRAFAQTDIFKHIKPKI